MELHCTKCIHVKETDREIGVWEWEWRGPKRGNERKMHFIMYIYTHAIVCVCVCIYMRSSYDSVEIVKGSLAMCVRVCVCVWMWKWIWLKRINCIPFAHAVSTYSIDRTQPKTTHITTCMHTCIFTYRNYPPKYQFNAQFSYMRTRCSFQPYMRDVQVFVLFFFYTFPIAAAAADVVVVVSHVLLLFVVDETQRRCASTLIDAKNSM